MLFDARRQITYQELDSWINTVQESLSLLEHKRVLISLPVNSESMACYLAAWNLVAAITTRPADDGTVSDLMKHWDCAAALVSYQPSAHARQILPGVWLWQPHQDHAPGDYQPGMGMLTSGTTGAAKLIMIARDQFMQHWCTGFMCDMIPARHERTWLGMPLWTDWGFVNAWTVYQTRSSCVLEEFKPGREVLHRALQECDVVHYGSALFKLAKVQPVSHGRVYVSGPNLSHQEKMRQADILGIPVLNHYGSTEAGCVSTQTLESWTRPGAGIPCLPYEIKNDVLWVRRMDDGKWWCMDDLVREESDGQITILGRASERVRTAAGMLDLVAARDFLIQNNIIDDGEFIIENKDSHTRIILVHSSSDHERVKRCLREFNNGVNFVDHIIQDQEIQRNEIGKIRRQIYLDHIHKETNAAVS